MTTRRVLTHVMIPGALILAACAASQDTKPSEGLPVRAQTALIQLATVPDVLQSPGTVRARTSTVVSSKAAGQIISLAVHEGDRVRQGQVLAQIESAEASAQLQRARAAVEEAARGLEEAEGGVRGAQAAVRVAEANRDFALATRNRYDTLREKRSISVQEYEEADTRYKAAAQETERARNGLAAAEARRLQAMARIDQARAASESATTVLDYSKVISPIDGIVVRRSAEPGMLAMPGLSLVTLEDPRTYELVVEVEESRVGAIRNGQSVRVEVDAVSSGIKDARVREIAPSSDSASRTYAVKLQLPASADTTLRAGLYGKAFFPVGSHETFVVPDSAVIRRGQLEGLYVVARDMAVFRLIKTGKQQEQGIEILSGVTAGTRILVSPPTAVKDGTRIIDDESARETP